VRLISYLQEENDKCIKRNYRVLIGFGGCKEDKTCEKIKERKPWHKIFEVNYKYSFYLFLIGFSSPLEIISFEVCQTINMTIYFNYDSNVVHHIV
jgi:hypothetical protein